MPNTVQISAPDRAHGVTRRIRRTTGSEIASGLQMLSAGS